MPDETHALDVLNDDGAPHASAPPTPPPTHKYRFLGTFQELSDVGTLSEFGQVVELTDAQFEAHGPAAQILTEAEFESCGFTHEELEKYANPADHEYYDIKTHGMVKDAPQQFLDKKKKALTLMQERQSKKG